VKLIIKNGRVFDPGNKVDAVLDILIEGGKVAKIGPGLSPKAASVIDAKGKVVVPGLVDMHTHLREPGREDKETLLSGSRAAVKGGFTTVCCMANTNPVIDSEGLVRYIYTRASDIGLIDIYPVGAFTKGLKGKEMSEIGLLKEAGVVALSDDGNSVMDSHLMRRALEYANMFDLPVISHCEDTSLSKDGLMNEGYFSTLLGLAGIPNVSEYTAINRDIELARFTGARLHIAHISTRQGVELVRRAKKEGVRVTAETCPHYFTLSDEAVIGFDTNTKVKPPLRGKKDVDAIKKGLADGTIDVIATDHAPHTEEEKDVEYNFAPFGMIGLETALSLGITELVGKKVLTISQLIEKISIAPANILGLAQGSISIGKPANISVLDPAKEWTVAKDKFLSKSKNSPFIGRKLKGVVCEVISNGKVVFTDGEVKG